MRKLLALIVIPMVLTGCSGSKNGPDEMSVIDHAALTLPPNYELRPPRTGQAPAVKAANDKAKKLILGDKTTTTKQATSTDSWLIQKAGGDTRDKSIRETMSRDRLGNNEVEDKKGWFESMFSDDENEEPTLEELTEMAKENKE